jgi:DNA-binding PadR family transcriptional regulator
MKGSFLGEFEEVVLLATCVLGDQAYANTVRAEVEKHTGRDINLSAIHSALYRMERKGFLDSKLGEATARRGGKAKRHFYVSTKGTQALNEIKRIRESFWQLVPATSTKGDTV